jgi:hypothetical protein
MENGMVNMSRSPHRDTNAPRDHPRRFYSIIEREDGLVDVYLAPEVTAYDTDVGIREYDISVIAVCGVVPWPGLEEDVRKRFDAWCESGEEIYL